MRIDCPKCGAAFAIDERRVPPRGVRAQCPLCGDRVVVRLPGGAVPAPAGGPARKAPTGPAATAAGAAPLPARPAPAVTPPRSDPAGPGAPAGAAEPMTGTQAPFLATVADSSLTPGPLGLVVSPFPGAARTPGAQPPARPGGDTAWLGSLEGLAPGDARKDEARTTPATPSAAGAFSSFDDLLDLVTPAPGPGVSVPPPGAGNSWPAPPPAFSGEGADPSIPVPEPTASNILAELAPPPAPRDADPFADFGPGPAFPPPGNGGAGRAPLPSLPIGALSPPSGRREPEAPAPLGGLGPPAPPGADGAVWRIRRGGGRDEERVNFARLKAMVEAQELGEGDEIARGEATFWSASHHPAVQSILRRSRPAIASAELPAPRRRLPRWVATSAGVVALLALGLVAWSSWPTADSPALRMTEEAFSRRVAAWKAALPPPPGTAKSHEKGGRALLREDTPDALRSALEEFRRAVVLDPDAARAIAGYVEARALLGLAPTDGEAVSEARELIDHAAQLAGQDPAVLRANAHLLLSLESAGNLLQARALAEAAVARSERAPDDLVALGRSHIGTNVELALRALDEALAKDPTHRRALLYRGQAKERVARYAAAAADYEARLALSPGDPEALRALLRVTATVGEFARVRKLLEGILARKAGDPEARLGLGVLAYQIEGERGRAATIFGGLLEDRTLPAELRGRAAGHAAALARESGNLDAAGRLLAGAVDAGVDGAPVRYQEALLALARGKPDEARAALEAIPAGALDPAERSLLEGRIHVAGTRLREAVASFQAAQREAPRRVEPYLHLAAAHARLGEARGAFGALRGALEFDPAASWEGGALSEFFESRSSRLAGLETPLLALAADRVDLALAHAAAGVVRYHRGEAAGAVPLLERTLDLDPQAMPALAYLAQIALDRGQASRALELARSASHLEKLLALGPFLEGRAHEALGQVAPAGAAYERALAVNPSFLPAVVRLGQLARRDGDREEAEKRFLQVFQGDPANAEAKVALFQLGR